MEDFLQFQEVRRESTQPVFSLVFLWFFNSEFQEDSTADWMGSVPTDKNLGIVV